jgi:hypothetical protein
MARVQSVAFLSKMYQGAIMKYTVFGVEEVYDAFDVFEHSNPLAPVVVDADSLEDAKSAGIKKLWNEICVLRAGFWSSGDFVPCVTQIVDADGYLLYQDTSKLVRSWPFASDERGVAQSAPPPQNGARVCFLSYNNRDEKFARLLFNELLTYRFLCWFAPERPEMPRIERVENIALAHILAEAICSARVVLIIISDHSVKSDWVHFEVTKAMEHNDTAMMPQLIGLRIQRVDVTAPWIPQLVENHTVLDFVEWRDGSWFRIQVANLAKRITSMFPAHLSDFSQ